MSLTNVEKASSSGERTLPKKGMRTAVLTGLIDVGTHEREFKGEKKKPARQFIPVFTLTKDTYETEEGEVQMRIQPFPLNLMPGATRGTYFNFIQALDPDGEIVPGGAGDITKLIGKGCLLNITHTEPKGDEGTVYAKISGYSAIPEGFDVGETDGKTLFFDMDDPDPKVFQGFPDFIKAFVRSSVGYVGSKTEELLESESGASSPSPKADPNDLPDEDEDSPV